MRKPVLILFIIVISQFCGTSLWFAVNAILPALQSTYQWNTEVLGHLTTSIQLGFILGTLLFAAIGVADRVSPSLVFCLSCLAAAASNAVSLVDLSSFSVMLGSRFLTGFFLAGIYPVGMKIAADWNEGNLGNWLGALVGALVLGTSFPHFLNLMPRFILPESLLLSVSVLAALGGILLLVIVKDGPFRKPSTRFSFSDIRTVFKVTSFRSPAFGYFGHMWELYAFWAFIPWAISHYNTMHPATLSSSLSSFLIIGAGTIGCIGGGILSSRLGSQRVATVALVSSGICCIISPLIWSLPESLFLSLMLFWGLMVVADSPQFSSLVARHAPAEVRGSAITLVTCIGFGITMVSIQLLNYLQHRIDPDFLFLVLAPGPALGIFYMHRLARPK